MSEVTERLWEKYVTAIAATGFPGGVIGEGVAYGVGYVGTVALTKNPVTGATVATFCADAGKWAGRAGGVILGNEIKQIINSDNGNVVASHRNGHAPLMHILGTQNDGNGKAWTYGVDGNDQQVIWRTNQKEPMAP